MNDREIIYTFGVWTAFIAAVVAIAFMVAVL